MPRPQKDLSFSVLLDYYAPALTEKQRAILTEYYNEDLSLAEIAENFGITRQGVRDAIKHGETALRTLEEQLGVARKERAMQADLDRLQQLVHNIRVYNGGAYTANMRVLQATDEMLSILDRLSAQEDAHAL